MKRMDLSIFENGDVFVNHINENDITPKRIGISSLISILNGAILSEEWNKARILNNKREKYKKTRQEIDAEKRLAKLKADINDNTNLLKETEKKMYDMRKDALLERSGILPHNSSVTIETISKPTYKVKIYILYTPKFVSDIIYADREIKSVGFPATIAVIKTDGNTIQDMYIQAVKDTYISDDTKLYNFPYSHVDSNGWCCFGSNKRNISKITAQTISSLPHRFLSMPYRNDYYKQVDGMQLAELFMYNQKGFKDELLQKSNMTYKDFVSAICSKTYN